MSEPQQKQWSETALKKRVPCKQCLQCLCFNATPCPHAPLLARFQGSGTAYTLSTRAGSHFRGSSCSGGGWGRPEVRLEGGNSPARERQLANGPRKRVLALLAASGHLPARDRGSENTRSYGDACEHCLGHPWSLGLRSKARTLDLQICKMCFGDREVTILGFELHSEMLHFGFVRIDRIRGLLRLQASDFRGGSGLRGLRVVRGLLGLRASGLGASGFRVTRATRV